MHTYIRTYLHTQIHTYVQAREHQSPMPDYKPPKTRSPEPWSLSSSLNRVKPPKAQGTRFQPEALRVETLEL